MGGSSEAEEGDDLFGDSGEEGEFDLFYDELGGDGAGGDGGSAAADTPLGGGASVDSGN
jgi:hypothetical protein